MKNSTIIILGLILNTLLFFYGIMIFVRKNDKQLSKSNTRIKPNTNFIDLGCKFPNVMCGNDCVSLGTNENCKSCGNVCPEGTECRLGECYCKNGNQYPFNSSWNCGKCGNECTGGSHCNSGRCVCPDYKLLNDNNNCGNCGNVCPTGTVCKDGVCV